MKFKENHSKAQTQVTLEDQSTIPAPSFFSKNTENFLGDDSRQSGPTEIDVVCFSHLRWNFVFQRPQHLLTRFAIQQRVFFIEEPIEQDIEAPLLKEQVPQRNIWILTPYIPLGASVFQKVSMQKKLIQEALDKYQISNFLSWYYTPMALEFTRELTPVATVYDCMDELSAFKFAPTQLVQLEKELMDKADVMFTGGMNLYEYKKNKHPNVHGIPSSIDKAHFEKGLLLPDPSDQAQIPHPRVGFYGVIDERMDLELLEGLAREIPDWHIIMIGPIVKIDPDTLPKSSNIHYLGGKNYQELPTYLAHWEVAMLPFALNESTRFISPTKTPEYLAALKGVVSTPIVDVVNPYGTEGLVQIADSAKNFAKAVVKACDQKNDPSWQKSVKEFLAQNSWDKTWLKMKGLVSEVLQKKVKT